MNLNVHALFDPPIAEEEFVNSVGNCMFRFVIVVPFKSWNKMIIIWCALSNSKMSKIHKLDNRNFPVKTSTLLNSKTR
jgi:hypothetical protein